MSVLKESLQQGKPSSGVDREKLQHMIDLLASDVKSKAILANSMSENNASDDNAEIIANDLNGQKKR